jgi:hypothetical protein
VILRLPHKGERPAPVGHTCSEGQQELPGRPEEDFDEKMKAKKEWMTKPESERRTKRENILHM